MFYTTAKRYVEVQMTKFAKFLCVAAVAAACMLCGTLFQSCAAENTGAYQTGEVFRDSKDADGENDAVIAKAGSDGDNNGDENDDLSDTEENAPDAAYYAEFYADGVLISKIPLLNGQLTREEPIVPEKRGYSAQWEKYVLSADENAKIKAEYSLIQYTIVYYTTVGTAADNPVTYTVETPEFTFNAVTRRGYLFCGWYKDAAHTQKIEGVKQNSTGNLEVYAKWREEEYSVIYETDGGENSAENPAVYTVNDNTHRLFPAEKKGFTFLGWYENGREISEIPTGSTGNLVLTAKWRAEEAFISAVKDGELIDDTVNFIFGVEDTSFSVAEKIIYASGYSGKIYRKEELSEQNQSETSEESDVLSAENLDDGDNVFYLLVQKEGSDTSRTYTLHVYKQYYVTVTYYYKKTLLSQVQALAGETFLPSCRLEDGVTALGWEYLSGEHKGEKIAAGEEITLTEDTSLCAVTE